MGECKGEETACSEATYVRFWRYNVWKRDRAVADPGEGPGPPAPHLFLYQNRPLPPLFKGLDDRVPPPLSQDLDPALSSA